MQRPSSPTVVLLDPKRLTFLLLRTALLTGLQPIQVVHIKECGKLTFRMPRSVLKRTGFVPFYYYFVAVVLSRIYYFTFHACIKDTDRCGPKPSRS